MIHAPRPPAPRLSRIAAASALAIAFCAPPANAQTVYIPAPPKPAPRPVWNCRAQQSVGTTQIHAARQLDAAGASLTDGAGWTDIFTADQKAPVTISVDWHPHPSPMIFADGMVALYFRTVQPMAGPIGLRLGGRRAIQVPAGQSYDDPHEFVGYERIDKVLAVPADEGALKWTLRGKVPGQGGAPIVNEGTYALAEVTALRSGFAAILTQLDRMQADFATSCRRL